ncbi:HutD family protein [Palleronia sediminis]|uniref:HutD family protein n=1 Tax=Palleronia sediminis TaxID=2547833 RepID=A0A4R6A446_9RHOB|nr:HutD family protein [Palleronia sediminis]TDL78431.1 HutD family protein [Palleronia sediminis]
MHVLNGADLVDVPWKNGGGITRRIARGMSGDRVVWTLSRADVREDGPFSNFEGLQRILTVVSNSGMDLVHKGGSLTAPPCLPVAFDGGLPVTARLHDGPLTDLNLMFDASICAGRVTPHHGPTDIELRPAGTGLLAIHVISGTPEIGGRTRGAADTLFVTTRLTARLAAGDAILEIALDYRDQSADITLAIASL